MTKDQKLRRFRKIIDQQRQQLAAIQAEAAGKTNGRSAPKVGTFRWSPAFAAVRDLRQRYELIRERLGSFVRSKAQSSIRSQAS